MNRRLLVLTALSLTMTTTALHAIEEPAYQVLAQDLAFELRQYEPTLLAGYIFGGNQGQRKIAMTAPVTQAPAPAGEKIAMTAPVTQAAAGPGRSRITFTMPRAYTLDTLPQPNDARVQFVTVPGEKRAVVRFAGLSTESNLGRHQALLQAWVEERGLKPQGDYVTAFYNDPFTLPWNRRNEWWVVVL